MDSQRFGVLSQVAVSARRSDIRDLLHFARKEGMISFAGGLPDSELFDVVGINKAIDLVRAAPLRGALQYGPTEGQPSLKAALAEMMAHRGLTTAPDDILVTTGSQQALDLLARALLNPGDLIAIESPTYLAAVNVFDLVRPRYLQIPTTPYGIDVDALVNCSEKPKVLYVIPTFSNPCGTTMSVASRIKLLEWASENRVFIIEDDPYGQLRFPGEPIISSLHQMASRDPTQREWIAYISSLSKTMAPGLRLGWMMAPPAVLSACVRIKQALDLHTSSFVQEVAAAYLQSGAMGAAVERMQVTYWSRAKVLHDTLRSAFEDTLGVGTTGGGMFLWARFNDGTNTRDLLEYAIQESVIFVPGSAFYPDGGKGENELRLSFVTNSSERIREGVQRLKQAHERFCESRNREPTLV